MLRGSGSPPDASPTTTTVANLKSLTVTSHTEASNKLPVTAGSRTSPNMPRKQQKILPNLNPQQSQPTRTSGNPSSETSKAPPSSDQPAVTENHTSIQEPVRRGRRPGSTAVSKGAREAARKSNHSRIEKLRREKINDAMQALRDLVPHEDDRSGKGGEEKEFKLEVLERTVVYLRKLKATVADLEAGGVVQDSNGLETPVSSNEKIDTSSRCSKCEGRESVPEGDDQSGEADDFEELSSTSSSKRPSPLPKVPKNNSVRLPPFASLIPQQPYEPLSPPHSGRLRPQWVPSGQPPSLDLPNAHSNLTPNSHQIQGLGSWTNEDESVASLLVQFSVDRSLSSSAQTPSSLLGIKRSRKFEETGSLDTEGQQKRRLVSDA